MAREIAFQALYPDALLMSVSLQFERSPISIADSANELSLLECGPSRNFLLTVSMSFQEVLSVVMKVDNTSAACHWVLLPSKRHQPGAHAPSRPVTVCNKHIERKLSSMGNTLHVYVGEEEWELCVKVSLMEERAKPNV